MASFNRVIIMGNLTRDPELKQLSSGQSVCRLGLASNRQFKNRQTGENIQEVCFVDIDVWGMQAESCSQYLQKGRSVLVEGRLKFDMWQDTEGQRRNKHSVVADRVTFLPSAQTEMVSEPGDGMQEQQAADSTTPQTDQGGGANKSSSEETSKDTSSTGEVDFKDQEPFKDDLPF